MAESNQLPVLGVRSKLIDVVMDLQVEVDQLKERYVRGARST
jgi:hypothetical protein